MLSLTEIATDSKRQRLLKLKRQQQQATSVGRGGLAVAILNNRRSLNRATPIQIRAPLNNAIAASAVASAVVQVDVDNEFRLASCAVCGSQSSVRPMTLLRGLVSACPPCADFYKNELSWMNCLDELTCVNSSQSNSDYSGAVSEISECIVDERTRDKCKKCLLVKIRRLLDPNAGAQPSLTDSIRSNSQQSSNRNFSY
jgi:hypothetical protein